MKKLFSFLIAVFMFCIGASSFAETCSQVHVAHILVKSEQEAKNLKTRIDNGENFRALAKEYSLCPSGQQGGDLGFFGHGKMVQEFEDAAFSTPVGQVSQPVETEYGWHLIKVYDKQ